MNRIDQSQAPQSAEIYRKYDRLLRKIAQNEEGRTIPKTAGQQDKISEMQMAEASRDFEALFIQQMLKEMRRTLREDSSFTGNAFSAQRNGNSFFRDQMYENISQNMANQGGFGIGAVLFEQLVLQQPSPGAAPNAQNPSAFVNKLREQGQALQQARIFSQTQLESRFQIGTTE